MHEMPYTQSILEMAIKTADGKKINKIYLRVGRLSAIVPESVQVFFDYLSKDTIAQGAELIFEMEPICLTCKNCSSIITLEHDATLSAQQSLAAAFRAGCSCKKADFKVSGGMGFDLSSIDVCEDS